jgi:hypothetical protein
MPPLVALVSRRARDRVICWIINSNGRTGWVNRMMLAQGGVMPDAVGSRGRATAGQVLAGSSGCTCRWWRG